jgi:5-methyltetrahydropteroyltriglutamate--homocysteine methyltransferase
VPELPLFPVTTVGSWPRPAPLLQAQRAKRLGRLDPAEFDRLADHAILDLLRRQDGVGVDVVTDGELRRDNLVDHFAGRLAGVEVDRRGQSDYYDYASSVVRQPLLEAPLGLVEEFAFTRDITDREVKFTVTGPHTLVKRIRDEWYHDEREFALALAAVFNAELKRLVAAGATDIQIDEPGFAAYPEDLRWGVEAINAMVQGVDARIGLHVCFGNRYGRPSWEGSYRFLFPDILEADINVLVLEFARKGTDDLGLFKEFGNEFVLGMGVIDVKDHRVETPEMVAGLVRRGLDVVPPERLSLNPDCGLRHLPPDVAVRKLRSLAEGAAIVRRELAGVERTTDS